MIAAPFTTDEKERIHKLYGYNILDTAAEKVFDDLTELASDICETPIALISLVDPERQWFKSTVGIDASETPRDFAFCAHAIHQNNIFEIPNALEDSRFFDNPLVTNAPNIRFYAGAPLITPEGLAIGTLCTISDKPKTLTNHQRKALEILSREVVAQLELRKNLVDLQKANDFTNDFLSNMSHEIRTPLNAICGFSELLKNASKQATLPQEISDYIKEIDFSSQVLLNIVNSVLDLSKIEAGKMALQHTWFNTNELLLKIHSMMNIKATEKQILLSLNIDKNTPKNIYLDQGKLSQILINILNNSLKFTEEKKRIELDVQCKNNLLTFSISDEGIGINADEQKELFNKYQQVNKNKSTDGTGLGLSITKYLVELMSGEILLQSEEGKGTTVTISLPLKEQRSTLDDQAVVITTNEIRSLRILVVEDNAINRKLAKIILEHLNQVVTFAENGYSAIETLKNNTFDLILMDINLPDIDGIEASHSIRRLNILTPIVALTADIFRKEKKGKPTFGFDDYLTKPINKDALIAALNKVAMKARN